MLQHARLRVGAVQQRDLLEIDPLGLQLFDFVDDERRLIHIGRRLVDAQLFAAALRCPQVLAEAVAVMLDQRVGRVENIGVRAVVLLQLDDVLNVKIAQQLLHVADIRAAKRIDRLVVVAHRKQRVVLSRQQLQPTVLQRVGVLELVHQNVLETLLVMLAQRRIALQQFVAAQQQLGKIHHPFALALRIVLGENLHLAPRVRIVGLHFMRAQPLLFAGADEALHLARRIFLVVDIHRLHQALDR